jgi:formate C-acetyltransferase
MLSLDEKVLDLEREYGCTERIEHLRYAITHANPYICSQRALIVTKAYQDFDSEPICMKRAKTFYRIMEGIDVYILPDELIVGHMAEHQRSGPIFPEYELQSIVDELDEFETREYDKFLIEEQTKQDLRGIADYWKGKTLFDRSLPLFTPDVMKHTKATHPLFSFFCGVNSGMGHICPYYEKILKVGYKGIKGEIASILADLDLAEPGAMRKYNFLKAVDVTCDGIILFARRYAAEAEHMAFQESSFERKAELLNISRICNKVPEYPAETFYEVLQSIWFMQLALQLESNGVSISPGRVDDYVYPYYRYSKNNALDGNLQEVLEAFWLKFTEILKVENKATAWMISAQPMGQNIVVGGVDAHGRDNTNELSYMLLDAQLHLRVPQPNFGARVHSASPPEYLYAVARTIRDANSMPQIDNDEVYIPSLLARGFTLEEARGYALEGCNEPGLPGYLHGRGNGGFFNQVKCLELALNDGACMLTGEQLGPHTGVLGDDATYEDVTRAYERQVAYFVRMICVTQNTVDICHALYAPVPFLSSMMEVLDEGRDVLDAGCKYNFTGPFIIGPGTTGNSLSALKDVVFDRKKYPLTQVLQAMKNNYEGYENIRKDMLASPKWCNDDIYVDEITSYAFDIFASEMRKYKNERGGPYIVSCLPMSTIVQYGYDVAATADGRIHKEPLSDSIGAQSGTDVSGATAMINSVCRLNHTEMSGGLIFNMRLNPRAVEGDRLNDFVGLIRTFIRKKGMQIQFNIISSEVLRKAQVDPEKYRGLTVRVAGYSAFFVDLPKEIQDEIIARNEHVI